MMMNVMAPDGANGVARRKVHALVTQSGLRMAAMAGACLVMLAGCNSVSAPFSGGSTIVDPTGTGSRASLGSGGGDGINDAALGVAASPRVTDQQVNLPRGGGRAQVGRPYRIAGHLYTPREDPNYDRTGMASWYGDAFHGRLTANGEVYDMHTLSAAHPTLPLPSYVRVTNVSNNRSVIVRVNDRGPFSHDRIIDLSKRAADVLDMRNDGVARVRVEYESPAPLHGQDVAWLEATATINGVPLNGADPSVMLARAPVPAPTPVAAPNQIALVSTTSAAQSGVASQPQTPGFLQTLFGSPQAQSAPVVSQPAAPASGAPMVLAPPGTQAFAPVSPSAPAPAGILPNAPVPAGLIPSATLGFMGADLEAGFTQRNQSALAQTNRIASAHQSAALNALSAAENLALQAQAVALISQRQADEQTQLAAAYVPANTGDISTGRVAQVQIGIFGDPNNVARLQRELSSMGEVVTEPIQSGGRTLTRVRLHAPAATSSDERALLRQLASQGYTDAYVTNAISG